MRPVDGRYEVFAGGMRLEAANLAGRPRIPVIKHDDCSDDEVAFLAEYDNENDEYHTPVSPVDIWAEYARLKSLGWIQQRIAKAKGLKTHTLVSERLRLHSMSDKVKRFVTEGKITEENLREIIQLLLSDKLSLWLTTSQAWEELAQKAVNDRGKNGSKSREAVKKDVENWQQFITYAEEVFTDLPEEQTLYDLSSEPPAPYIYRPREQFIKLLAERSVRSLPKVPNKVAQLLQG